jgi:uncharacterized protein YbjT (DUF2867 family)
MGVGSPAPYRTSPDAPGAAGRHEEAIAMHDTVHDSTGREDLTLVVGGTGKTGRRVAARLRARGVPVRAASRSSRPSFDWADRGTWDGVLEGAAAVYLSYAPDLAVPGARDHIQAFTEQAVAAGARRLVLLSGRGEAEAEACERIVQAAGVDWTVVRASWFDQNFSEGAFAGMVLEGTIALPAGDVPEPFVDAEDIAEVAVAALTEDGHAGRIYEVTGPRLLTFAELADELSRASGREVRFVPISMEAFRAAVAGSGAPADLTWLLQYLFETVLDGRNAHLGDGVQRALGRTPVDFADYARRVAAEGAWRVPADAPAA